MAGNKEIGDIKMILIENVEVRLFDKYAHYAGQIFGVKEYYLYFAKLKRPVSMICGDLELENIYKENKESFNRLIKRWHCVHMSIGDRSNPTNTHDVLVTNQTPAYSFEYIFGYTTILYPVKYVINGRTFYYRSFFEELGL